MTVKLILRDKEFEVRPGMTLLSSLEKIAVLPEAVIARCLLKPCRSIEATIAQLAARTPGGRPSICVLPEGPLTIAYVRS